MLSVYTVERSTEWDDIVRSFSKYDTYWLCGYVKAFQIHGEGEPLLFYYDDGCGTRAINVVMKRDIAGCKSFCGALPENTYFDFSTPYGYGGWLIEGENTAELFGAYELWCKNNNIVSEFVRFHPVVDNHVAAAQAYETVELGYVVTMDLSSKETLYANITSKNRNVIRKAQKNGVKIYNGRFEEIFREFREVYNETMDKDNADSYYYFGEEFYKSIVEDLPYNAQMFYAVYEGRVIAASIMLMANGMMNYHLSGSRREFSSLAPTNLLLYEAALWGCHNGYKTLYLGGGVGSAEDSLFKFKKAFYRQDDPNRFVIGKKIFNSEIYDRLVSMREDVSESGFFPKYRA
ncbi:MAG: GNAT family N-acetyltransferase [Clostridia bacterium]|nr:GNAT family N-acetyltransferase [Clostridia bacterium]